MLQLKHEEETRRRAEAALKAVQAENARLAAEAKKVKMYTRRTGGGFVVSFATEAPAQGSAAPATAPAGPANDAPPEDAPADA